MNFRNIYLLLSFSVFFVSCTKELDEINTNPNAPIEVQPEFQLRKVIFDYTEQMSYEGFVAGNLLGQYFTAIDFNLFDRHGLSEPQFGGNPWPILYRNLRDNEIILKKAQEGKTFEVYKGPALVMKAYMTAALTDIFGDVPYSEALKGKDGIITPAYDKQEEIYLGPDGIIANLDAAVKAMKNYQGAIPLKGDVLYSGNLQKWIKLANSLKLKSLIRISAVANVKDQINALISEGLIASSADDAVYHFTTGAPNNFRMVTARVGDFNLYIESQTMSEVMKSLNDPREATFFRPAANSNTYKGLLNGPDASKTSISVADYSLSGTIFREKPVGLKGNLLTSWEVNFLLAEAAFKGYISGDAKAYYDLAVTQAFEYWATPMPADYLTAGASSFDTQKGLEQIITQKWLGNIINGYEGWIEYKRTGFPKFKQVSASLNNGLIPVRMPYPTEEEALNSVNFQKATAASQGNNINQKVWWNQ